MQKNQRSRDFTVTQQFSDSFLRNQRAGVPRFRTAPLEPVRENHLASRRVAQKVAVVANSRVLRSSPHDEPATFIARGGPQVHEYFRCGTPVPVRNSGSGAELRFRCGTLVPVCGALVPVCGALVPVCGAQQGLARYPTAGQCPPRRSHPEPDARRRRPMVRKTLPQRCIDVAGVGGGEAR